MTPKYCPNCGTKAQSATAKFCGNCGQSLNTLTTTAKTISVNDYGVQSSARQLDDFEDASNVMEVPKLDGLQVSISGDDDDERYVQTLNSFSLTADGGAVAKRFKPKRL